MVTFNYRSVLNQLSNRDMKPQSLPQVSRNVDSNTHALNHLQTSFVKNDSLSDVANSTTTFYTELDCVWLLYCRNLAVTAKLGRPYGIMARING